MKRRKRKEKKGKKVGREGMEREREWDGRGRKRGGRRRALLVFGPFRHP
jgi:hypothetical protein